MPVSAAVRPRVRVEMRPEGGKKVRGAELSIGEVTDAAGSVVSAKPSPCEELAG